MYEHIVDPLEQRRIAQIIINLFGIFTAFFFLIAGLRPHYDFNDTYFVASYQAQIKVLEAQRELYRELINSHIEDQSFIKNIFKEGKAGIPDTDRTGFPDPLIATEPLRFTKGSVPIGNDISALWSLNITQAYSIFTTR